MGYMCHHAIIVSSFGDHLPKAHEKAKEIIGNELISEIIKSPLNHFTHFFICPDGSKEGWKESNYYEEKRKEYIKWLKSQWEYKWCLIQYADDDNENLVLDCY